MTQKSHQAAVVAKRSGDSTLTSAVSWRPEGVKHRKNEVFLDVVEAINLTVDLLYFISVGQCIRPDR